MTKQTPLSILLENARAKIITETNKAMQETGLPAFLLEGILLEVLSDVRARKAIELTADYNAATREPEEKEADDGGHQEVH